MRLFGVRIRRQDGEYVLDAQYKMGKGRVVRSASDQKRGGDRSTVIGEFLAALGRKGILESVGDEHGD